MIEKSFFKLMDLMGPFENKPHIAVGVSGGSDSMCLCLLCNKWIQKKNIVEAIKFYGKCNYSNYLSALIKKS